MGSCCKESNFVEKCVTSPSSLGAYFNPIKSDFLSAGWKVSTENPFPAALHHF